ncbi:hypothetical protein M3Y97_01149600 [Aphelenchoides bicaudatus]|nr:hypothetical protein M3Y97_01149600 [Aphelenchoides bicaudatus]
MSIVFNRFSFSVVLFLFVVVELWLYNYQNPFAPDCSKKFPKKQLQFKRPNVTKHVPCADFFDPKYDRFYLAKQFRINYTGPEKEEALLIDCNSIRARNNFHMKPMSKEEEDFPIAFARNVNKDYLFQEMILSSMYAPQNYYCYSIDGKATSLFRKRMENLAKCFPNILITDFDAEMDSFGHYTNDHHLECLKLLATKERKWKYVAMLQNYDVPLKTNQEMVQILSWYNGANDITTQGRFLSLWEIRQWLGDEWDFKTLRLFKDRPRNKLVVDDVEPELVITRSLVQSFMSRKSIDFIFDKLDLTKTLKQLNNNMGTMSDEILFSALNSNDNIKLPGGFTQKCANKIGTSVAMTRFNIWWQMSPKFCDSKIHRHNLCIFGLEDLRSNLVDNPFFFANKMIPEYDFGAIVCWNEKLFNRTHFDRGVQRLNKKLYVKLPHVRFHNARLKYGKAFNMNLFDCTKYVRDGIGTTNLPSGLVNIIHDDLKSKCYLYRAFQHEIDNRDANIYIIFQAHETERLFGFEIFGDLHLIRECFVLSRDDEFGQRIHSHSKIMQIPGTSIQNNYIIQQFAMQIRAKRLPELSDGFGNKKRMCSWCTTFNIIFVVFLFISAEVFLYGFRGRIPNPNIFSSKFFNQNRQNLFKRPESTKHIPCNKFFDPQYDHSYLGPRFRVTYNESNNEQDISTDCDSIRARSNFHTKPMSKEEEDFPIAFARNVNKDYLFQEMILSSTYAPQNYYCYSIDGKATSLFRKRMENLAQCFPNILITDFKAVMDSFGHYTNDHHLSCLKMLANKDRKWKYVAMLQNHDVPLKTNQEMVQILTWYGGANDITTQIRPKWIDKNWTEHRWDFETLRLFKDPARNKLTVGGSTPDLPITRSLVQSTMSRESIDFIFEKLDLTRTLKQLNSKPGTMTDEVLFSTLNSNDNIQLPGGFTQKCAATAGTVIGMTRYNLWSINEQQCDSGFYRHNLCIFGLEDLGSNFNKNPFFFANKMIPSYDFGAIVCWNENLFNRTHFDRGVHHLDKGAYVKLPQVRYNEAKKQFGTSFDFSQFNCVKYIEDFIGTEYSASGILSLKVEAFELQNECQNNFKTSLKSFKTNLKSFKTSLKVVAIF